ncbi:DUF748 domain-containing protein [Idiomarina sp. HP20-50]|uniref:DUF748 domain-containing protein n=1 Tax=Idiomarina sp. HP20-50 TaxID=3070813 RepID=UPI00294AB970|nr:DUF748 domain-containing protein [Idiomarina sp. HP20-50]MDV6317192.1 DUF748 domain-containing protein [Idiomarina sp. HP20-50]
MQSSSFSRFCNYLKEKWASPRRIRFWLLALVVLYTLLGFFAVPWAIQYVAVNTAKEDFNRELSIKSVHANPYTLTLEINGLELNDIDKRKLLGWDKLFIDLAWSSIIEGAWVLETIRLDHPVLQEERFASGETRLSRLPEQPAEEPKDDKPATLPALKINSFNLNDGVLRFADNLKAATAKDGTEPQQVSLALQNIDLSVKDFALQKNTNFPVRLNGQLAAGGRLNFDGTMQLLPNTALEGNASINELALKQATPYLQQFAKVQLNSGTLSVKGQINTSKQQPFAYKGSADINTLDIRKTANNETLIGWQSLQAKQLDLNIKDTHVKTGPIKIKGLSGRIIIYEDQTTNFGQLLTQRQEENSTNKNKETSPFTVTIEGVELADGAVHFSDNSLPLPFATKIHALHGEVSTLSSKSDQPANVTLEGEVAQYGLAQVNGAIHAWHPTRQTNVHLRFRNLQVPEYSPYTVDFAGRKIADGTMDLDLDYIIDNKKLDGKNNLVLHDLKLGEKVESSNAMDLPLDLAIALLQDSDGVIDLTLPVSGDVGNPKFDFGEVIQQALGNAITSVVTAPFSFLANLVGADSKELGRIEFLAGRADLLPPQRQRIAKLREALNKRPALALELAGPFSRQFDGPALRQEKAINVLQQRLTKAAEDADTPSLTAESNQELVEAMFTKNYPETDLEAVKASFTEEEQFDALAYRNYLAEKVIAAQPVTEADLRALGNARAQAVNKALVNSDAENPIAADRVRVLKPKDVDSVDGERIAMEIGISAD